MTRRSRIQRDEQHEDSHNDFYDGICLYFVAVVVFICTYYKEKREKYNDVNLTFSSLNKAYKNIEKKLFFKL